MSDTLSDFDLSALFPVLARISETASSEERKAIEIAARCLHFVNNTAQLEDFREDLRNSESPDAAVAPIAHTFISMSAAQEWLRTSPRVGALVKIGLKTHAVWRNESRTLILLPSFTPQDIDDSNE
jgi:hypothetical protein